MGEEKSEGDDCPSCEEGSLEKLSTSSSYLSCTDCDYTTNTDKDDPDLESEVAYG